MSNTTDEPQLENLTDYWLTHFTHPGTGLCSLCGNTGRVDTRLSAISPAGVSAGLLNYCICPNGQSLRTSAQDRPAFPTEYQPEYRTMKKDTLYAALHALQTGLENTQELLEDRDSRLGRSTRSNRTTAERLESEIETIQSAIENLRDT